MPLPLQWPGDVQFGGTPSPPAAVCRARSDCGWLHRAYPTPRGGFRGAILHPPSSPTLPSPVARPGAPHLGGRGVTPHPDEAAVAQALVPHGDARDHRLVQLQQHGGEGGWGLAARPAWGDIFAVTGTPLPGFEATTAKGTAALRTPPLGTARAARGDLDDELGEGLRDDLQQVWGVLPTADVEGGHHQAGDVVQVPAHHLQRQQHQHGQPVEAVMHRGAGESPAWRSPRVGGGQPRAPPDSPPPRAALTV